MQQINKDLLKQSAAGMRLIAQMTFFNSANFARLKTFVEESYHPALFDEQPVKARIALLKAMYRLSGKQKIIQVIAVDKYEVAVLIQKQDGSDVIVLIVSVEEEYPHRILRWEYAT